ncbi:ABC transporter substrate-binding protein [Pantoea sp. Ap-967]|uniref:ABC transporter substrate-binding protein n=1 Tax=Pantoea sp. Ap-967 TaxID=2608362 RepID=UPI00142088B4|nr:ABC transporter substrate-binding protein [Pantoea sp. Ap-967]NIE73382.1 ABC transporter substrate-binding protein [Pantoea sp. Ap-967]
MTEPVSAFYSICPLLVASNLAVELGWLDEEFERAGATARYLRSLPGNGGWLSHFDHSQAGLIRDGGATPALWARAEHSDTVLLATTATQRAGQILVRADGRIRQVADLFGKRIGVPVSRNAQRIDVLKVVAEQGITSALALADLQPGQVRLVPIEDEGDPHDLLPARRPAALWAQLRGLHSGPGAELQALAEGRVDALHVSYGHVPKLLASGQFTVIEDLERYPDWTLKNQNGPYVTTVDRAFAEAHPEVVVAFLRAAIRAGRWIAEFPEAAASLLTRVTFLPGAAFIAESLRGRDLVPNLAPRNLAALQLKQDFLLRHGYLQQAFDVQAWAQPDYLAQAHAGL